MTVPDSYFNRTPPTVQEMADYDEYLDSLPKHGSSPLCDNDVDDRSDELVDQSMWTREDFIKHSAEDDDS